MYHEVNITYPYQWGPVGGNHRTVLGHDTGPFLDYHCLNCHQVFDPLILPGQLVVGPKLVVGQQMLVIDYRNNNIF